ncbi:MAG TPA: EAL domain-containing protein, partial [Terracidiphilus sp.]|nr:EAL domain-containing protein [Terracidiphilus sp.]
ILLSVHFARRQALENGFTQLHGYASDVLRRSEGAGDQSVAAFHRLHQAGLPPCSAAEIDLMRQIELTSSYMQAVGRTENGQLVCSSLGAGQPMSLGPESYVLKSGLAIRVNVRLPVTGGHSVIVLEQGGFATIIDPTLPLDTMTVSPDMALGNFSPGTGTLIARRGRIDPTWLKRWSGSGSDFIDQGMLVAVLRSKRSDVAAIAAAPVADLRAKTRSILLSFVPIGLLCGLMLAGAVLYLARIRLSMPADLRAAARRNEFFVEYQPVVDFSSRKWVGAEALVRWRRGGETVRPDLFIPIAEESGIISLITECVLEQVAADLPVVLGADPAFHVAVNLSAADLQSPSTPEALRRLLAVSGSPPANLMVEATERGFLHGAAVREIVDEIRALGISIAIDDFGTGYSSLSRLETLNLSYLKIDKSFVETIGTSGATSQVVLHIIEMARSLGLEMIAEGVETEEQARFLAERGVRFGQGWLFGKPMKLEVLLDHLAGEEPRTQAAQTEPRRASCRSRNMGRLIWSPGSPEPAEFRSAGQELSAGTAVRWGRRTGQFPPESSASALDGNPSEFE